MSSKRAVQFEHDGKIGINGSMKGQSLSQIRNHLVLEEVQDSVEVKPLLLRQYFLQQGNIEDAKRVEEVNLSALRVQGERVMAEVSLAGTSFLEGFLSVYGIELERAVQRYEEKLQLFETLDRERQQRAVFIGRLKQGELEQLSPSFQTEQQAKVQLEATKQHFEEERAPQQQLNVEHEE